MCSRAVSPEAQSLEPAEDFVRGPGAVSAASCAVTVAANDVNGNNAPSSTSTSTETTGRGERLRSRKQPDAQTGAFLRRPFLDVVGDQDRLHDRAGVQ